MRWLSVFYIFLSFSSIKAEEVIILETNEKYEFGKLTYVLPDPGGKLNIEDVVKSKNFTLCKFDVYNGESDSYGCWIKFHVKNTLDSSFYLVVANPYIDIIDLYTINSNQVIHLKRSGTFFPFEKRDILRNNFFFKLDLPKNELKTFYIKYSTTHRGIPLGLSTLKKIDEDFSYYDLGYGILFGILSLSFIYNFILFLLLRDLSYFYYCIYILGLIVFRSITLGYLFQYIFPNTPSLNHVMFYTGFFLIGTFTNLFATEFLNTKQRLPSLHLVGYIFMAIYLLGFIFSFYNKLFVTNFLIFIALINAIYIVVIGLIIYNRGYLPAKFYLIASSAYMLSIMIAALRVFEILPYTFITINIINFGAVIEATLFAIALGHRYNMFEREKRFSQEALNKELKLRIKEKAKAQEEQKKLNEELKNSNLDLDNFVYTASHDLKVPIVNIEGLINLIRDDIKDRPDGLQMLDMMHISVEKFKNTVNDLTEVTSIQEMRSADIEENSVKNIVEEIESNLKDLILETKASIVIHTGKRPTIKFPKMNFYRIIEALLTNAIKFRSPERKPEILIETLDTKEFNILEIKDNGLGISDSNQGEIFSMFKRFTAIEGRGVSLYLCKRIIENEGGRIEIESTIGKGSTFRVYFKK